MRSNITPNRRQEDSKHMDINNHYDQSHLNHGRGQDPAFQVVPQNGYTEFFSWGNDEDGQLGHGQESPNRKKIFNLPKSLSFEVLISQVSCGFAHTAFISKQGYVFSFGSNSDGQLGVNDPSIKFSTAPLLVSELISMQASPSVLSCGGFHTGIVTAMGEVYLWGRNIQGQCGKQVSYNQFLFSPQKLHVDTIKTIKKIDCGDSHTALITNNGELFTFGDNSEGQLGIGMDYKLHNDRPTPVNGISEEIISISCGNRHTLVLTDHGTVYGMGTNKKYELGLMNNQQPMSKYTTPIRIQALEIYMITKVQAGSFSAAMTSQNEILVWGSGEFGQFQTPQKIYMDDIRFIDISLSKSSDSFGCTIDTDGFIYTWGQNQFGQLGLGDFRYRKLPTKVPQLRKKKVRSIACGGGFVVALGKDVPEGAKHKKKNKEEVSAVVEDKNQLSYRSRSQANFGGSSSTGGGNGYQSSLRRKNNDGRTTELNFKNSHSSQRGKQDAIQNKSFEQQRSPHNIVPQKIVQQERELPQRDMRIQPIQPVPYQQQQQHKSVERNHDLSNEIERRQKLERDLKDKEYELQQSRVQQSFVMESQNQLQQYKHDNEILRNALEKEQENSYKLLKDMQKSIQDNKLLKDQLEDRSREVRSLQQENKRQIERAREVEVENDKLKKDASYIVSRSDSEVQKMRQYIEECEQTINEQRERLRDSEKQINNRQEQQRIVEVNADKYRMENADLKRQITALQDRLNQLQYQTDAQNKENDDLKYDNTLLYEKNVEKDERLLKFQDENEQLKQVLENEKTRVFNLEKDNRRLLTKIAQLEDQLQMEIDRTIQKEKVLDDIVGDRELMRKDLENQISEKCIENDNIKRAFDELQYEAENLRRMVSQKSEEIGHLNKIIGTQSHNNNELIDKIQELENTIRDVEEKNKRLVDLLNANMYNRAEQYKEKVLTKLQERTPNQNSTTPNKYSGPSPININQEINEFRAGGEPSPIRLQQILNDEKEQIHKDRERLLKGAEDMGKHQQYQQEELQLKGSYTPHMQRNDDDSNLNTKANTGSSFNLRRSVNDYTNKNDPAARLRISDILTTPGKYGFGQNQQQNMNQHLQSQQQEQYEDSPERIADILKQQSPLRKKLAVEALGKSGGKDYSPLRSPGHDRYNEEDINGGMTASKITKTLVNQEMHELKNRLSQMQKEKNELDQRLHQYESSQSRYE